MMTTATRELLYNLSDFRTSSRDEQTNGRLMRVDRTSASYNPSLSASWALVAFLEFPVSQWRFDFPHNIGEPGLR